MLADHPIFVVMAVAVLAPMLAQLPVASRLPVVVLEVMLGILVGPHALRLVGSLESSEFLQHMHRTGLSALLFMAGMEIDLRALRGGLIPRTLGGWLASVAMAFAAVALLHVIPGVHAPLLLTIALTTTMLGALVPSLKDNGLLASGYGRALLAAGTVGEIGPIVATSVLLSGRYTTWQEALFLLLFLLVIAGVAAIGMGVRAPRALALIERTMHASTQLPVRLVLLIVAALTLLSIEFGFEGILGAFAAGMVVGMVTRGSAGEPFRAKLDAVYFGFLAPFFFVGTGIAFDPAALTGSLTALLLTPTFLLLFLVVRGAPTCLFHRGLPRHERLPFALSTSVASLGLVVVITEIGTRSGVMRPDITQALIAAALLSLLLFPTLAAMLLARHRTPASTPVSTGASNP